jgi:class 3 adenylate cyclase/tetratricopeptide (TPR) repeat protein
VQCPSCGADAPDHQRFCGDCGTALTRSCPACGEPATPGQRFCGACGTALETEPSRSPVAGPAPVTAAELRMVSVLFVDLVGFTTLSESRDAEDMRDLLSRYFDTARTIVGRYGGAIEKFIGDAVMAVWGAPTAREDDAERAVRAGLDLLDAITAFGASAGSPDLRARAGVVTGRVAAQDVPAEGLVTGDSVNTAARIQSVAEPGHLFVDETTRQVTSSSIAYSDAGEHELKGKAEPVHLWRAERVVAGVAGARTTGTYDIAMIGRDPELRLVKELFHATIDRSAARLVAVSGTAGVGKSRLGWEFEKYLDGIAHVVLWHRGRCLSYGDGVAYWALAEMVRSRLGITEEDSPAEVARQLDEGLRRWIEDDADRAYVEPRLGVLLGVGDPGLGREELFAGWRVFFEHLAAHEPVILCFEDLQWADTGLIEFIDHLLEWSAGQRIFILAFARPELSERRDGWPAGHRTATSIYLEPLGPEEMGQLLDVMVEDLPADDCARIAAQAEGIPLYAVETMRALADRGVLAEQEDGRFRVTGDLGALGVPASLSSLLAARLDGLEADERDLAKAMSVFGGTFPRSAAVALADLPEDRLDAALTGLVRKEILVLRADPLAPDRGQYAFAQTMVRTVAYELLSRRERKPRHLAAAAYLRSTFADDGDEVAEVIASHYVDALSAAPADPGADELRAEAIAALRRAGQRSAGVGAPDIAERAYREAAALTTDERERADLEVAAGTMAHRSGRFEEALALYDGAIAAHRGAGRDEAAARVAVHGCQPLRDLRRMEESMERARSALAVLGADRLDPDVATLNHDLSRSLLFVQRYDDAVPPVEEALRIAQALGLEDVLCTALATKGTLYTFMSRWREAELMLEAAAQIARERGLMSELHRAQANLGNVRMVRDLAEARSCLEESFAITRRGGHHADVSLAAANLSYVLLLNGDWDEVERLGSELFAQGDDRPLGAYMHERLVELAARRGDLDAARRSHAAMGAWKDSEDGDLSDAYEQAGALIALAADDAASAFATLERLARGDAVNYGDGENFRAEWPAAMQAALALGRIDTADELIALLEQVPPGIIAPYLRAHLSRGRAQVAAARGQHDDVEQHFRAAADTLAVLGYPYWLAVVQTDLAEWLRGRGRTAEAAELLEPAIATLQRLRAEPALRRARDLSAGPDPVRVS